jgi:nucleotide-binding universal stress UspA family protein
MPHLMEQKEFVKAESNKRVSLTKILAATDFSRVSDRALDYAIALARRYDARIYLTHVITPDPFQFAEPQYAVATYEKVRQEAQENIASILISGKLRGVPHEVLMAEGNVWPNLEKMIEEHDIDLVVVGTHGRGRLKKFLMGSVAEEIFRRANTAVLTVGPEVRGGVQPEIEFNHILMATDFGHGAEKAAAHAFSLAQEHNAKITLLHVVESGAVYDEETLLRQREINIVRMKQLMPPGTEDWCKPEFRVTFGLAQEEILTAAGECKADLIVMGAKAQNGMAGYGPTIAYNVVSNATCPVLTVRG